LAVVSINASQGRMREASDPAYEIMNAKAMWR
jgi:hypothetical protein